MRTRMARQLFALADLADAWPDPSLTIRSARVHQRAIRMFVRYAAGPRFALTLPHFPPRTPPIRIARVLTRLESGLSPHDTRGEPCMVPEPSGRCISNPQAWRTVGLMLGPLS
ncbi:hypothetical protein C2E23DRAFT_77415 [Lenzites betulinus]|nr:hypothetical protein C2E23DRAFT_77415 [Lenzites betulinus]